MRTIFSSDGSVSIALAATTDGTLATSFDRTGRIACAVWVEQDVSDEARDRILRHLLESGADLLSFGGPGCARWEDAADDLIEDGPGDVSAWATTSEHQGESLEAVIEFALAWSGIRRFVVVIVAEADASARLLRRAEDAATNASARRRRRSE